jgi:hypothetical protein
MQVKSRLKLSEEKLSTPTFILMEHMDCGRKWALSRLKLFYRLFMVEIFTKF